MHELSIATSIINLLIEQQAEHKFERVQRVNVNIGEFSSIVPDSLEFAFSIASKNTIAENAELVITVIPLILRCRTCNKEFHTEPYNFICPYCQSAETETVRGDELQIESIEV